MTPVTAEWVAKAEGDLATATREAAVTENPNPDAACFHAQQCVEKYMKALLVETGKRFARTHDLEALLEVIVTEDASWEDLRTSLVRLTSSAVEVRYPGFFADAVDVDEAIETAKNVRSRCRSALGLSP